MNRTAPAAIAAAIVLPLASVISPLATASESSEMCAAIFVEISQPSVCVSEDDGVVTLTGNVESQTEKVAAERAAMAHEGVSEVVNLIAVSD